MELTVKGPVYVDLKKGVLINPDGAGRPTGPIPGSTRRPAHDIKPRRGYRETTTTHGPGQAGYQQQSSLPREVVNRPGVALVRTAINPELLQPEQYRQRLESLSRAGGQLFLFFEGAVVFYHRSPQPPSAEHPPKLSSVKKYDASQSMWNSRPFAELFPECIDPAQPPEQGNYVMVHRELASVSQLPIGNFLVALNNHPRYPVAGRGDVPPGVYRSTPLSVDEAEEWLRRGENVVVRFNLAKADGWTTILISQGYNERKAIRGDQSVMTGFYHYARENMTDPATQRAYLAALDPYHQLEYEDLNERVRKHLTELATMWADLAWRRTVPPTHAVWKYTDANGDNIDAQRLAADDRFFTTYNSLRRDYQHYRYNETKRMTLAEKAGLDSGEAEVETGE